MAHETVYISQNQTINKDLFLSGDRMTIDGTVNGNIIATGGTVVVKGKVNGSLIAAAGVVEVDGTVRDGGLILSMYKLGSSR